MSYLRGSMAYGPKRVEAGRESRARAYMLLAVLTSLPFLFAPFPPSTDLPQHIAQIRLASDVLAGRAPQLLITWGAPNNLVYLPLAALYALLSATWAARVGLWLLALTWGFAALWLARQRGRSSAAGLIVGVLAFQAGLYWGFLNFLLGWPFFVVWLQLLDEHDRNRRWRAGALCAVALALYGAHILWFAAGALWALVDGIVSRRPARELGWRALSLVPGALLAARWYPTLTASRALFRTAAVWSSPPWQRLSPTGLAEMAMGGAAGPWPGVTGAALLLWGAAALVTRWRDLAGKSDRRLLWAGGLLAAIALFAPDRYMNTLFFAQRWGPCAVALLIIGLPAPRLPRPTEIAVAVLGLATVATCVAWHSFSSVEMTGFETALAAAPPAARVLELDTVGVSRFVGEGRPFIHMMAYLQAKNDGTLSFSFAEHGSELVAYREPGRPSWTPGLEWHPERATMKDILMFDVLLVNAVPEVHRLMETKAPVSPVTTEGRWRLYTVHRPGRLAPLAPSGKVP